MILIRSYPGLGAGKPGQPLLREEKIDFVSHHAAQIDLRHSVADPIGDARANVIGFEE